jgi:hypothetical protein
VVAKANYCFIFVLPHAQVAVNAGRIMPRQRQRIRPALIRLFRGIVEGNRLFVIRLLRKVRGWARGFRRLDDSEDFVFGNLPQLRYVDECMTMRTPSRPPRMFVVDM